VAQITDSGASGSPGWEKRKERLIVERAATEDATESGSVPAEPSGAVVPAAEAHFPDVTGLLDGMPRQRGPVNAGVVVTTLTPAVAPPPEAASTATPTPEVVTRPRLPRPWRLFPTPTGTPFTFAYAALLAVTSLFATHADPALVRALYQASSTDVAHLLRAPVPVLLASALWIAGGLVSPYVLCFLLVLTALERRIGGLRTAGVFLFGHVVATLATEVPVGLAVLVGHLPDSSLHRFDYGISFGVATCVGALAGLLTRWVGLPLLALFGGMLLQDLIAFTDPMTNWGHLIALTLGVTAWPVVRRWHRERALSASAEPAPGAMSVPPATLRA
jgi:hypothetical protein